MWTPATRLTDSAERWLPVELAACSRSELPPGVDPIITPITNGLGAGDTAARAQVHGLLELIQRDGNTLRYRALDTGTVLDVDGCDDPEVAAVLARFRDAGLDPLVKLAGTDLGCVNVWATAVDHRPDPDLPLAVTAGGEAADPDPVRAVRKALCELAAARSRKAFCHGRADVVRRVATASATSRTGSPTSTRRSQEPRALAAMVRWAGAAAADLAETVAVTTRRRTTVPWDAVDRHRPGAGHPRRPPGPPAGRPRRRRPGGAVVRRQPRRRGCGGRQGRRSRPRGRDHELRPHRPAGPADRSRAGPRVLRHRPRLRPTPPPSP